MKKKLFVLVLYFFLNTFLFSNDLVLFLRKNCNLWKDYERANNLTYYDSFKLYDNIYLVIGNSSDIFTLFITDGESYSKSPNIGYVVIVAWENPSAGAPHYATVRPCNNCKDIKDIKLCNVSTKENTGEFTMSDAFGVAKIKNCHFYVNKNQVFREDYNFSGTKSDSIVTLESKHGVE